MIRSCGFGDPPAFPINPLNVYWGVGGVKPRHTHFEMEKSVIVKWNSHSSRGQVDLNPPVKASWSPRLGPPDLCWWRSHCWTSWSSPPLLFPLPDRVLTPGVFIYLLARAQAGTLSRSAQFHELQQGQTVPTWNAGGGGAKNTNTLLAPGYRVYV